MVTEINGIPTEFFTDNDLWELQLHHLHQVTRGETGLRLSPERLESIYDAARVKQEAAQKSTKKKIDKA